MKREGKRSLAYLVKKALFMGVLDGVYNAWILFGRVPATSLNYKKMVTAGAELKIH